MNLHAIKTAALVVCGDAEQVRKNLRKGGYVSIAGTEGMLAVLNISGETLERMCRNNDMSIKSYLQSDNDTFDDVLRSAGIPAEEMNRVDNAIYRNALAAAGSWNASGPDAEALVEWTVNRVGYSPYYWRRVITKGL